MEKLLKLLETDARLSLEELAAMTGKTPADVAQRMDDYKAMHIINGYKAIVDWERAGIAHVQAIIELRVSPRRDCGFDEIAQSLAELPEVDSVMLMSGGYDLALVVSGKSFQDIALFVARRLAPIDGVLSTATHFVLRTYKRDGVPFGTESGDERECLV